MKISITRLKEVVIEEVERLTEAQGPPPLPVNLLDEIHKALGRIKVLEKRVRDLEKYATDPGAAE